MASLQTALECYRAGNWKEALKVASYFRIGVTRQQRAVLRMGYECLVWPSAYAQMGVNEVQALEQAKALFISMFVQERSTA